MRFRWTIQELREASDAFILRGLVAERKSELNPYGPLATRLQEIYANLDAEINSRGLMDLQKICEEIERKAKKETEVQPGFTVDLRLYIGLAFSAGTEVTLEVLRRSLAENIIDYLELIKDDPEALREAFNRITLTGWEPGFVSENDEDGG